MGTRNLTAVFSNGEYKVAQYGQWDGYPDGQGKITLDFCRLLSDKKFRSEFENKLKKTMWITPEEVDVINEKIRCGEFEEHWSEVYPELSRDTGAKILELIANSESGLKLKNNITFAADSLFCEWGWVIDLDNNTFEAYKGFNETPLSKEDRFYGFPEDEDGKYHGIKLVAKWNLDELPTDNDFFSTFSDSDEEE